MFERLMQGRELDPLLQRRCRRPGRAVRSMAKSCRWSCRPFGLPPSTATGNLWVSFVMPYTYVFGPDGRKIRTVQFRAAGHADPGQPVF